MYKYLCVCVCVYVLSALIHKKIEEQHLLLGFALLSSYEYQRGQKLLLKGEIRYK